MVVYRVVANKDGKTYSAFVNGRCIGWRFGSRQRAKEAAKWELNWTLDYQRMGMELLSAPQPKEK